MTPQEKAENIKEKGLAYNKKVVEIKALLRPYELELDRQHVDTLKDLAIVSGAIAAISLAIFSTDILKITGLLIAGVALFLINVFYIFRYLILRISDGNKKILEIKKVNLVPFEERVQDTFKVAEGKMTYEEFVTRDTKMLEGAMKELSEREIQEEHKLVHNDEWALAILGIALVCIISSFLLPYLYGAFPFWKLCLG